MMEWMDGQELGSGDLPSLVTVMASELFVQDRQENLWQSRT